jgi:ATP-dependent DNA ligase
VRPALVCEAAYLERTAAGVLRAPSFQGLRLDVKATAVALDSK